MLYIDQMQRLSATALERGCRTLSVMTREWDCSADCERPVTVELFGRPSATLGRRSIVVKRGEVTPLRVIVQARCRACTRCLRRRARLWSWRSLREARCSVRNWLGTLTLSPDFQIRCLSEARAECDRQGVDYDALEENERFRARVAIASREITKWLKRVRKESGSRFRYCLVAEAHKSGDPHFHIVVNECDPVHPVRHRTLVTQWKWGFSKFNLLKDEKAVTYATKYLSKSKLARVRASLRYGDTDVLITKGKARESIDPPRPLRVTGPVLEGKSDATELPRLSGAQPCDAGVSVEQSRDALGSTSLEHGNSTPSGLTDRAKIDEFVAACVAVFGAKCGGTDYVTVTERYTPNARVRAKGIAPFERTRIIASRSAAASWDRSQARLSAKSVHPNTELDFRRFEMVARAARAAKRGSDVDF